MHRRHYLATTASAVTLTLTGCSGAVNESTPKTTTTTSTTTTPSTPTHFIGDTFTVGAREHAIEYTVRDVSFAANIGTQSLYTDADGAFVIVVVSVENIGDASRTLSPEQLHLVDADGRRFDADTDAHTYAVNDERLEAETVAYDQLQPGLRVRRSVIFDVSRDGRYALLVETASGVSGRSHLVGVGEIPSRGE